MLRRIHWRLRLAGIAVVLAGASVFLAPGLIASGSSAAAWQDKVDASVLTAAAAGQTEFLVYLERQADLSGAASQGTKAAKGRFVYDRLTEVANQTQPALATILNGISGTAYQRFWISNTISVTGGLTAVQAMAERSEVAHVYAMGRGKINLPAQPKSSAATEVVAGVGNNIAHVKAPEAWALGYRGQGATVAGADTGVAWQHPALKGKYRGWDGTTANHSYNWHDAIHNPNAFCSADSPQPCDDDALLGGGHGTHTVGTIVGDDGAGNQIGMAPDAKWIACRNMNNGFGIVPMYMECMQWFIAPTNSANANPDPSKGPDVVNNSWGCVEVCPPPLLQDTLQASRAAGIFYAVSAGNDGVGAPGAPGCSTIYHPLARYPEAFTVGSTIIGTDKLSSFSSRGPVLGDPSAPTGLRKPDITAPGSNVRSALRNGSYGSLSGTSMAGPHVAGIVALIISAKPSLAGNVDEIERIIERSAVKLTTTEGCGGDSNTQVPNNTFGHGRIDALAAVRLATNRPPVAVDDTATTDEETPVTIAVAANDTDADGNPLKATAATDPANGTTSVTADGKVRYTPDAGFNGTDTFEYTVSDDLGDTDTGTVTVTVAKGLIAGACGEIDDTSSRVAYKKGWALKASSSALAGTYHRRAVPSTGGTASTVTLQFTGDLLALAYGESIRGGNAEIRVDGNLHEILSFGENQPKGKEVVEFGEVFLLDNLGAGQHTLTITHKVGAAYLDAFGFACG